MGIFNFFSKEKKEKLDQGLEKTKTSLFDKISKAIAGKSSIDDDFLDKLEEILVSSDVGIETTLKIIDRLQKRVANDKYVGTSELNTMLKEEIAFLLDENNNENLSSFENLPGQKPYVIMVVGVNGVGKTTTIGKLANQFKKAGKKVVLGAGDTFRAAATDQIAKWAEKTGAILFMGEEKSDPASVAYKAVTESYDRNIDVLFIDTAGRLNNQKNLFD